MEMIEILEFERKHNQDMLEGKLEKARYENRQAAINSAVSIIAMQMELNTRALFAGLLASMETGQ